MPRQEEVVDEHSRSLREHDRTIVSLVERTDGVRRDMARIEAEFKELTSQVQEVDKRLAVLEQVVERLEKKIDELLARRWELWKLVLAAFLGSILTLAASFAGKSLDRLIETGSRSPSPASDRAESGAAGTVAPFREQHPR